LNLISGARARFRVETDRRSIPSRALNLVSGARARFRVDPRPSIDDEAVKPRRARFERAPRGRDVTRRGAARARTTAACASRADVARAT